MDIFQQVLYYFSDSVIGVTEHDNLDDDTTNYKNANNPCGESLDAETTKEDGIKALPVFRNSKRPGTDGLIL